MALGTNVIQGQKIASMVDISKVKITIGVTEKERAEIREGQSVDITSGVYPEKIYAGSVYSVGIRADEDTLTFPVEIVVDNNQEPILKPGMVVNAAILTTVYTGVIALPRDILTRGKEGFYAWTISDGRAQKVEVETGTLIGSQIIIHNGLNAGTLFVTFGFENLLDGSPVKIIE
jgi:RND family efflux transporter MFP subunit